MGWPEETDDLKYFYPTDVLVTGYDILFFWVIRMVFSGYEHMGAKPFKTVLFHGLVRDSQGRKMSKSLGNGIDPLEVIEKYGADALRFTLVTGNAPGNDMRFSYDRVEASRNFANKIWNASRFILMNMQGKTIEECGIGELEDPDKWILHTFNLTVKEVTENMEKFELGIAAQKIYDFIWDSFCDWYIEIVKPRLYNTKDAKRQNAALWTLKTVLTGALKLLHPYMPFVTESIYSIIREESGEEGAESIMISDWPLYRDEWIFRAEAEELELIKEAVKGVRNVRSEMNVAPSKKADITIVSEDAAVRETFEKGVLYFSSLVNAGEVRISGNKEGVRDDDVSVVLSRASLYIPLKELVDISKEIDRLKKEELRLDGELKRSHAMLSNERFLSKAPKDKIDSEKEKLRNYEKMMEEVKERLGQLA